MKKQEAEKPGDGVRAIAINTVDLLNDIATELHSAVWILRDYSTRKLPEYPDRPHYQRLCVSAICIALYKLSEMRTQRMGADFREWLTDSSKRAIEAVDAEIDARDVRDFRKQCVAHVMDKTHTHVVTASEADVLLDRVVRGDLKGFAEWIAPSEGSDGVLGTIRAARDEIAARFCVGSNAVTDR